MTNLRAAEMKNFFDWVEVFVTNWSQVSVSDWSQITVCSGRAMFIKNRFAIFSGSAATYASNRRARAAAIFKN
ncbi:hypothetical protein LJC08_02380 [Methanimicrococcus sp. OttesenSCG-928-J09]|nr:hypothetical protein [Methanimicrococcus sp. OttesenSCG-928-J09]